MSVTLFASVPQNSTIPVLNTILIFFLCYTIQFIVQCIYVVCNAKKIFFDIYEKWATYPVGNCPCDSCFSIKLNWIDIISKLQYWNKKYYLLKIVFKQDWKFFHSHRLRNDSSRRCAREVVVTTSYTALEQHICPEITDYNCLKVEMPENWRRTQQNIGVIQKLAISLLRR